MKLKTSKRARKARGFNQHRYEKHARRIHRLCSDHWFAYPIGDRVTPGRLIPASKLGRGRWRR